MSLSAFSFVTRVSARRVTTLTLLAIIGFSGVAHAAVDDCVTPASDQFNDGIQDGDGVSGCTANDFGVANISNTVVLDDGCAFPGDTITISGEAVVSPSNPARYDIGIYVATNGTDALDANANGPQCDVYIIPAPSTPTNDGDQCGDYAGGGAPISVVIASATFACADLTGPTPGVPDGFADVQVCSSYKQNSGTTGDNACPSYVGATPGTSSKCNCEQVVLDPPIIVPSGCTTGVCCPSGTFLPSGTTCRGAADVCDEAEACTGASSDCPVNGFLPSTVECRGDAGQCDVAEVCTGTSAACPANGFEASGTSCGSPTDTICDNADTCNSSGTCLTNNEPGTTVCRADAGQCDVAETCDGAGSCPGDSFEANGTSCGSSSDTICDNADTCVAGSCQANNEPGTTECRADTGQCDVAELCDGAGSCPGDSFESAGTSCGSASDTVCDNADTCNGSGTCQPNNEPGTTVCRADTGQCDVAETCDGAGSCPADGFETNGTSCGSPSDTICDNADTCNGSGTCLTNNEPGTTVCRADAGQCDVAETCDGAGSCPADGFETNGTSCGSPSDTICDNADTCVGGSCQANNEPGTTECRADTGQCDVAETCDGAGACPADGFEANGTSCGSSSDTICDNADTCNGSGLCQVNNEPGTVVCRADAGECDVAENCDGAGSCPANGFEPALTSCGSATDTECDNPDTCNGSGACQTNLEPVATACGSPTDTICDNADTCNGSGTCQPNNEPGTTLCRADQGECDVAENCDGAGSCPNDVFEPAATACGSPTDTFCDGADTCNGSGACQTNLEPTTTVCRGDTGECDVAENCDGAGSCPADGFEPAATSCGSAGDTDCDNPDTCNGTGTCNTNLEPAATPCGSGADTVCDNADTCNGSGTCQANPEPSTTVCRADSGQCDDAETCDGAGNCPIDSPSPDGTSCDDFNFCTTGDSCTGGTCFAGGPVDCEDNDLCTMPSCNPSTGCVYTPDVKPIEECFVSTRGRMAVSDRVRSGKDVIRWSWRRGDMFTATDVGSPATTAYAVCLFDHTAGEPVLISSMNIPAGAPKWKAPKRGRYRYIDSPGTFDGIRGVRMRSHLTRPNRSKVLVRARGVNLNLPPPVSPLEYMDLDPALIAQFRTSDDVCWSASFLPEHTFKNTGVKYRAKYRPARTPRALDE